jgi:phosphatidylglycerophosphatase C
LELARAELAKSRAAPAVAIFDLDGTLTRGDTYLAFLLHVLRNKPLRLRRCLGLPGRAALCKLGYLSREALKAAFLRALLKGATRAEVEQFAIPFAEKCVRALSKPAALRRIDWHRTQGHRLVLASASVDLYVPLVGALLGFDETVCTRVAWRDDRLTGDLDGPNLRGDAKLQAVRTLIARHPGGAMSFAYSDSHADLPLLAFADYGVAVDPDRALHREAARRGLMTENWRD